MTRQDTKEIGVAASRGDAYALFILGLSLLDSDNLEDVKRGWQLVISAAKAGSVDAQELVGMRKYVGRSSDDPHLPNKLQCQDFLRRAHRQGHHSAGLSLAKWLLEGGMSMRESLINLGWVIEQADKILMGTGGIGKEIVCLWQELAYRGSSTAQFEYGRCLLNGWQCTKDEAAAFDYLQLADLQGSGEAWSVLGRIGGPRCNRSMGSATEYKSPGLRELAEMGDMRAQFDLGLLLSYANTGDIWDDTGDEDEISFAFQHVLTGKGAACKPCLNHGDYCQFPEAPPSKYGMHKNRWEQLLQERRSEAFAWWRRAAAGGLLQAQCNIGVVYLRGYTFHEPDLASGLLWLSIAADSGTVLPLVYMEATADQMKQMGNTAHKDKIFDLAVQHYSEGINVCAVMRDEARLRVFLSNRSASFFLAGKYQEAIFDAQECISVTPNWPKGYYRLGMALEASGDTACAARAFQDGLMRKPTDSQLQAAVNRCSVCKANTLPSELTCSKPQDHHNFTCALQHVKDVMLALDFDSANRAMQHARNAICEMAPTPAQQEKFAEVLHMATEQLSALQNVDVARTRLIEAQASNDLICLAQAAVEAFQVPLSDKTGLRALVRQIAQKVVGKEKNNGAISRALPTYFREVLSACRFVSSELISVPGYLQRAAGARAKLSKVLQDLRSACSQSDRADDNLLELLQERDKCRNDLILSLEGVQEIWQMVICGNEHSCMSSKQATAQLEADGAVLNAVLTKLQFEPSFGEAQAILHIEDQELWQVEDRPFAEISCNCFFFDDVEPVLESVRGWSSRNPGPVEVLQGLVHDLVRPLVVTPQSCVKDELRSAILRTLQYHRTFHDELVQAQAAAESCSAELLELTSNTISDIEQQERDVDGLADEVDFKSDELELLTVKMKQLERRATKTASLKKEFDEEKCCVSRLRETVQRAVCQLSEQRAELVRVVGTHFPERLRALFESQCVTADDINDQTDGLLILARRLHHYDITGALGQGKGNHAIFLASYEGKPCVLKKYELTDPSEHRRMRRECRALRKLHHPNVIRLSCMFLEHGQHQPAMYVQLPYYCAGDFADWLKVHPACKDCQITQILHQAFAAVAYVHAHGILHRDVKLENILLERATCDFALHAVLADFDISGEIQRLTPRTMRTRTLKFGTPHYQPPCYCKMDVHSPIHICGHDAESGDMYALGVCLLKAHSRDPDYMICQEDGTLEIPNNIPKEGIDILKVLLSSNASLRSSAAEVLSMPYFSHAAVRPNPSVFDRLELKPTEAPPYWQHRWLRIFSREEVDVTKQLRAPIQSLLDATFLRPLQGMDHKSVQVKRILRIEDMLQWRRFANGRAELKPVEESQQLVPPVMTMRGCSGTQRWITSLGLDCTKGEVLLWHGTLRRGAVGPCGQPDAPGIEEDRVAIVAERGFEPKLASVRGWYGHGVYFAENSSLSDLYAGRPARTSSSPASTSVGEEGTLFLARVCLGQCYVTQQKLKDKRRGFERSKWEEPLFVRRPPCIPHGHFDPPAPAHLHQACCNSDRYDSIVADFVVDGRIKEMREFVCFNESLAYPEYIVEYGREGGA